MNSELKKTLVLVGMMGAGKTHIGRMLAKACAVEFFDSDDLIVEKAGMAVPEIFAQFGEDKFRDVEHKTILEMLDRTPCVLSTGGGAVLNDKTRAVLQEKSTMIWVDAPLDVIWSRVRDCKDRPLLQTQNPRDTIAALIEARKPLYETAHIHIVNDETDPHQTIKTIINSLS